MTEELAELPQRVLACLEEFRQEIVTLLNTAVVPSGQAEEIVEFRNALKDLIDRELIRVALVEEDTGDLTYVDSINAHKNIAEVLDPGRYKFRDSDLHWMLGERSLISVETTETGSVIAARLLNERGYEWWWGENLGDELP